MGVGPWAPALEAASSCRAICKHVTRACSMGSPGMPAIHYSRCMCMLCHCIPPRGLWGWAGGGCSKGLCRGGVQMPLTTAATRAGGAGRASASRAGPPSNRPERGCHRGDLMAPAAAHRNTQRVRAGRTRLRVAILRVQRRGSVGRQVLIDLRCAAGRLNQSHPDTMLNTSSTRGTCGSRGVFSQLEFSMSVPDLGGPEKVHAAALV